MSPKVSREVEIIRQIKKMKDFIRVATRYATKVLDEEHLQILKELLNMEDTQLTDDERDNSTDLTEFNFKL